MKKITKCRSCQSQNLEPILSLGDQYLSCFVDDPKDKGEAYPLDLVLCGKCSLLQLAHTTPQRELYNDGYGYKSGINNTIRANLADIVALTREEVWLDDGDIWLSIGENDGTLLSFVPKNVVKIGVEPIKKLAQECEQHADIVINDFWSYKAYEKQI